MNEKLFAQAKILKVNDVVRVTALVKHDHTGRVHPERILDTFTCRVSSIEVEEQCVNLTYVPCRRDDTIQCGFGCHFIRTDNCKACKEGVYGWQSIEVIGTEKAYS